MDLERAVESISLADVEGHWAEIIEQAEIGLPVTITREGKPIVMISRIDQPQARRPKIDLEAARALTSKMTYHGTSAAELIREMRDSRY